MSQDVQSPARVHEIHKQAARRRTFAVISHPDAGKSTLTEALALHAKVIGTAGASSGKANRKETVSDRMQMEKDRGMYRIIDLESRVEALRARVAELIEEVEHAERRRIAAESTLEAAARTGYRGDLVPLRPSTNALVVWRPRQR